MPVSIKGTGGGSVTLSAAAAAADTTLTLPNTNGTVINTAPGASGNVLTSDGTNWTSAASAGGIPTGGILQLGSSTTPSGYLKCDGSTYTKSSYPALAAVLGSLPVSSPQYNVYTYFNSAIFYTNSLVIAIQGGDGVVWVSSNNGSSFTGYTITSTYYPFADGNSGSSASLVWTGTNYVSPAGTGGGTAAGIVYSSSITTTTWTNVTSGINVLIGPMAYTGSRVVAVATSGGASYYSTTNGTSWSAGGSTGIVSNANMMVYAAGLLVVGGGTSGNASAYIATSTDGTTWTSRTIPSGATTNSAVQYITYQNSLFIATTTQGAVYTSPDGITWTFKTQNSNINGQVMYLAATSTYYVNGYYSTDLVNWGLIPVAIGQTAYIAQKNSTDGTRIYAVNGFYIKTYNPFYSYTTSTQFIVPNYGVFYQGSIPIYGAYYYIKT